MAIYSRTSPHSTNAINYREIFFKICAWLETNLSSRLRPDIATMRNELIRATSHSSQSFHRLSIQCVRLSQRLKKIQVCRTRSKKSQIRLNGERAGKRISHAEILEESR